MKLISVTRDEKVSGIVRIAYQVDHCTPGPGGTVMTADLVLTVYPDKNIQTEIRFGAYDVASVIAAVCKMRECCARIGEALQKAHETCEDSSLFKIPLWVD